MKATGFGRVDHDVPAALRAIAHINPAALIFGTDLPSPARRGPFEDADVDVVRETAGERALWQNAAAVCTFGEMVRRDPAGGVARSRPRRCWSCARHHGTVEALAARIDAQRADGYRVVASFEDDVAAAVAGFRIAENPAWGRFLYVDDLVTRAAVPRARARRRGDGVGRGGGRAAGCGELHLDSGVGPDREDAHRFYFRHRMRITLVPLRPLGRRPADDRHRAPPPRRRGEGARRNALRRGHAGATGCCTRGRCWPPRRTRGSLGIDGSAALARAGRRRGADGRGPAARRAARAAPPSRWRARRSSGPASRSRS